MERGEVRWAELSAPFGRRPVVLVSRDEAYSVRRRVAVVEVTTTVRGLATEVALGRRDGLPGRCVANADGVHTIVTERIGERMAWLRPDRVDQLDRALRFALAL